MSTYTHTSTYTNTRIEVIAKQFERGLYCAGLSQRRIKKILGAIKEKKISAIGIYALDYDRKRIAEVEISVDWTKHENLVKVYGSQFEYMGAINGRTGEAAEPKVYVNALIQLAKDNDYELSCWIKATDATRKSEREYNKLLWSLGFGGGIESWKSKPEKMSSEQILALEEMKIQLRGVNGDSRVHRAKVKLHKKNRLRRVAISIYYNIAAMAVLILMLPICGFITVDFPWKACMVFIPTVSHLLYYLLSDTWSDNKYGGWTKYDTIVASFIALEFVMSMLENRSAWNGPLISELHVITLHAYVFFVLSLTTHRDMIFQKDNGIPEQRIKTNKILAYSLSAVLFVFLVISTIVELRALLPVT